MEWLSAVSTWFLSHPEVVGMIVLGSILLALVCVILTVVAITRMSPDYFISSEPPVESWRWRHPLLYIFFKGLKSAAGLALLITGIAMLVLPGQGLLTIFIGISLLDFPGKRTIELQIVRNQQVLKAVNWIRIRAKQAPVRVGQ